jgi:predicted esterase
LPQGLLILATRATETEREGGGRGARHPLRSGFSLFLKLIAPRANPGAFVSHGVNDRVLAIDVCSRRIVPQLRSIGYVVDCREFPEGHTTSGDLAEAAFDLVSAGKQAR